MRDRLLGLLLFLPVPVVLWLFTRMPLGDVPSLALGVALVVTHRAYARPFALARAATRCLWCGRAAAGPVLTAVEPLGTTEWRACGREHHESLARVLAFAARHARLLQIGVLGTLGVFLPSAVAASLSRPGLVTAEDTVAFFRLGIAASVLPLGWLGERLGRPSPEPPRVPFPLHIQALIGTRWVLWLFRLVGLAWLALGLRYLIARA